MNQDFVFLDNFFGQEQTKEAELSLKEAVSQLKLFITSQLNPESVTSASEVQRASQKQQNREEIIKKKKEKAMRKLQKKRKMFQQKNQQELKEQFHHFNSQHSCILCHQSLIQSTSHPYGITGYIGMNRLYFHAYKSTLKHSLSSHQELKQGQIEANLPVEVLEPRTYLQSCGHCIHLKCYNDYKMNSKLEGAHQKLLELDQFQFLCPLCKTLCNFIFPATLNVEIQEQEIEDTLQFKFELPHTQNLFEYLDFEGLEVLASQSQKCRRHSQGRYFQKGKDYLFKDFKQAPQKLIDYLVNMLQNAYQVQRLNSSNFTVNFLRKNESRNWILTELLLSLRRLMKQHKADPQFELTPLFLKQDFFNGTTLHNFLHKSIMLLVRCFLSHQSLDQLLFEPLNKLFSAYCQIAQFSEYAAEIEKLEFWKFIGALVVMLFKQSEISHFCEIMEHSSSSFITEYLESQIFSKHTGFIATLQQPSQNNDTPLFTLSCFSELKFNFIQLPQDFSQFQFNFCSKQCKKCNTYPPNVAICLLCGQLICAGSACCAIQPQERKVGEMAQHTLSCGGDECVFITSWSAEAYFSHNKRVIRNLFLYRNEFGQPVSDKFGHYMMVSREVEKSREIVKENLIAQTVTRKRLNNERFYTLWTL